MARYTGSAWVRTMGAAAGLAVVYCVAYAVGMDFYIDPENVATLWLGNGLITALLLTSSRRHWPVILGTQLVAHTAMALDTSLVFALGTAVANIAGSSLTALGILRLTRGRFDLWSVPSVLVFVACVLAGEGIAALIGAAVVVHQYPSAIYGSVFQVWWFATALGGLLLTPVIMSVRELDLSALRHPRRAALVEGCVLAISTLWIASAILGAESSDLESLHQFPYVVVLFLVWAAVRFKPAAATSLLAATMMLLVYYADRGLGPFVSPGHTTHRLVLEIQAFTTVSCLTVLVVAAAISERKRAEEDRAIIQEQLQRTQRLESLGVLAGGIAHDFNNMLTGICGFTELTMGLVPDGSRAHLNLQQIAAAGDRARDLVRQILAFSRQAEHRVIPVALQPILKETARFLRSTVPTTIEIRQDIPDAIPLVMADPTHLHQIILNLCTNANQAMADTGGQLGISLSAVEIDDSLARQLPDTHVGSFVRLTVSDTGCGMDEETRSRIFDPFFTTKPPGEGTGLGLATVHGLVTSMGGAITVYSEPGSGAVFHVYLPAGDEGVKAPHVKALILPTGHERILVVDDEASIVTLAEQMLSSLGYIVTATASPMEALAAIRKTPEAFDLLLTDETMPGMTGTELAHQARHARPDLPIVIMSGFSPKLERKGHAEPWLSSVLKKPYALHELSDAVRSALETTVQ